MRNASHQKVTYLASANRVSVTAETDWPAWPQASNIA
jgi:hypothetical protein